MFGKPMTKKKYDEQQKRRRKYKRERDRKEKERLSKKLHDDGANLSQKLVDHFKEKEKKEAAKKSGKVFKYKKGEYKAKIKNYAQPRSSDMSMEQLFDTLKKQEKELKKKEDRETKLFGRPKKEGEVGV